MGSIRPNFWMPEELHRRFKHEDAEAGEGACPGDFGFFSSRQRISDENRASINIYCNLQR